MATKNTGAAVATARTPIVNVRMQLGKTTKSTHVFNGPAQLPTLYIPKLDFPNPEQPPTAITVVVAPAE